MGAVLYPPTKENLLRVAHLGLAATLSLSLLSAPVLAQDVSTPTTVTPVPTVNTEPVGRVHIVSIHPELRVQLRTKKAGSVKFWEAVSWCETNHDWDDGGYYAGGLGIAKSTWRGYGGRQFAPTAKTATKEEQIIVANRIAFFGFQVELILPACELPSSRIPQGGLRLTLFGNDLEELMVDSLTRSISMLPINWHRWD